MTKRRERGCRLKSIPGRCLHLLDIDNLVGRPDPSVEEIAASLVDYGVISVRRSGDLVWICCSSVQTLLNVAEASRGEGVACRLGPDGAELAIDELLDWDWVAERFSVVSFGSGDHFFAARMAFLASRGVDVTCVARDGSLSAANRVASHRVRLLPKRPMAMRWTGGHDVA